MSGFIQLGLVLGGFGIPIFNAWRRPQSPSPLPWNDELFSPLPAWAWLFFIALALTLRLAAIPTLPAWPNSDESGIGIMGLRLSQHWAPRFFYSFAQTPPLTFWLNALCAKGGLDPRLCLWLPSAVVSVLTLGAGYVAARRLLNSTLAFLFTALLAFSFWPLYTGRHCHEGMTLPLFEFLVLLALVPILLRQANRNTPFVYFIFGLTAGLGLFTFTSWVAVALVCALMAAWGFWKQTESRLKWIWFLPGMGLGALPFLRAVFTERFGAHMASLTPWSGWFPWAHQFQVDWHYLTVLFWGAFDPESAYTPVEGGFLNPLLGAFFFLGLIQIVQRRKESWAGWVLFSIPILLLPGLLSMNLEAFRIIQILPVLLFTAALGLQGFLEGLSLHRRWPYLVLFLLVSLVFDFYRMADVWINCDLRPENFDRPVKSVEKFRAYQILNQVAEEKGPGLLLTDFDTEAQNDATLTLCTASWDASRLASQKPGDKSWVGLFVNVHYQPFLEKRFPEAQWVRVGQDLKKPDGGMALGILPVDRGRLPKWLEMNDLMREVDADRLNQPRENWDTLLAKLTRGEELAKGDPFLESIYWDKVAAFEYGKLDYAAHLAALQHAVKDGYPTAALCFELGNLYLTKGYRAEAVAAYQQALKAPLDLTPSGLMLKQLTAAPAK